MNSQGVSYLLHPTAYRPLSLSGRSLCDRPLLPRTGHRVQTAMAPAVAPEAFPRKRFVNYFTSRFRGNANLSSSAADRETGCGMDYLGPRSQVSRADLPSTALYSYPFGCRLGRSGNTCCRDSASLPWSCSQVNRVSASAHAAYRSLRYQIRCWAGQASRPRTGRGRGSGAG
jgi:hypothetical protein